MKIAAKTLLIAVAAVLLSAPAQAAVKLNPLFSDGAVLQQRKRVPVWGTASEGERVTVRFRGQTVSTRARDGEWMVRLQPTRAGGPFTMTVSGENTIELKDILVGEVWIAGGQSNMEWPVRASADPEKTAGAAKDPMLRLFTVQKAMSDSPLDTLTGQWAETTPDSVMDFSAVAYHFGRELRERLGVPVGLIDNAWGGTRAEAWTSRGTLAANPDFRVALTEYQRARLNFPIAQANYQRALSDYQQRVAQAKAAGQPAPPAIGPPPRLENPNNPSVLYNAMLAPLVPYAVRGVIWYQGESNAGRAYNYQTLFPAMIADWREAFGQGNLPFLFVQLAPFMAIQKDPQESAWAELREAQRLTDLTVPNTEMAVITDLGDEKDIHPRQKAPVGHRLALAALATVYERDVDEYSGPELRSVQFADGSAILRFRNAESGLVAKGGELTGFTIAGEDRRWVNAKAVIQGDVVIVSSPQVREPVAVRFGWANYPVVNLFNKAGLPATPFRTDNWPMTTRPQR